MNIQFVNLQAQYLTIKKEIDKSIMDVITNTSFIGGKPVADFEDSFAKLYGVDHCISVANGTDSLYVIMKMLGIGSGDEVITVANSWISSSETISQTGATPIFVDIEHEFYSIDPALIESKITKKTKAIIPVHLHGQSVDMDAILRIAAEYNLFIIEDCAQSHFSEFHGKRVGTFGIASSFSFYPGKNLGAYGDAGAILTNDEELALKCRMFSRHGALIKHKHEMEGINSRMDGIQAAILCVKLKYILNWTNKRIEIANYYTKALSQVPQINTPNVRPKSKHTFHLFVIRAERRDELMLHLKAAGIEVAIHYPTPLPMLSAYRHFKHNAGEFPVAVDYAKQILSLPIYPELSTNEIDYIVDQIQAFYL